MSLLSMLGSSSLAPFQKYAHNISPVLIPYLYQLKTLMRQNFHFLHIALVQCSVSFFLFFRSRSKVEGISSRTSCYLTGKPLHQKSYLMFCPETFWPFSGHRSPSIFNELLAKYFSVNVTWVSF